MFLLDLQHILTNEEFYLDLTYNMKLGSQPVLFK